MVGMCAGYSRSPVDSMREAVLTVSPKRQYRGIVRPTTPATQGPEKMKQCLQFKDGINSKTLNGVRLRTLPSPI